MTKEAGARGIGDAKRRAAIGYCFGGHNVLDLARAGADAAGGRLRARRAGDADAGPEG